MEGQPHADPEARVGDLTVTLTLEQKPLPVKVTVTIKQTEHGPLLTLTGTNCDLEGQAPGEYLLVRHEVTATGRVLTGADFEALADEAERGYDISRLKDPDR